MVGSDGVGAGEGRVKAVDAAGVGGPAEPSASVATVPKAVVEPASDEAKQPSSEILPRPPGASRLSRAALTTMVERSAKQHRLDLDLVHALIRAESAYDPHAVSHAGAVGLMQVMPATAVDYGISSVEALFDPSINLDTGMRHLKRLLDKYGNIGHAVMAYNAGEGALEGNGGFVTYPETQRYTHAVIVAYLRKKGIQPYTAQARQVVGIDVTPAMAWASSGEKSNGGSSPAVGETAGVETLERAPVTRLSSRLAPRLSRRSESGSDVGSKLAGQSIVNQNRARFSGDGR
ncbi:lytic transglycosylase domain-containing protein [Thiocapsa sp.]|uniref:lytic transglycosylase domain-containing protein n=1 Tax=Thiocapsa sp. TaxID=2024551 RepID=UPI003593B4B2